MQRSHGATLALMTSAALLLSGCSFSFEVNSNRTAVTTNANLNTNAASSDTKTTSVLPAATSPKPPVQANGVASKKLMTYTGSWFSVNVPDNFEASPALEAGDRAETDEARFTSPDGRVEFFVYSPQWGGETGYTEVLPTEQMQDEQTTTSGEGYNKKVSRYVTLAAKDGSYMRSFVRIRGQVDTGSETQMVFGIRYKDQASYDAYKEAYVAFKESLEQYAD